MQRSGWSPSPWRGCLRPWSSSVRHNSRVPRKHPGWGSIHGPLEIDVRQQACRQDGFTLMSALGSPVTAHYSLQRDNATMSKLVSSDVKVQPPLPKHNLRFSEGEKEVCFCLYSSLLIAWLSESDFKYNYTCKYSRPPTIIISEYKLHKEKRNPSGLCFKPW